MEAKDNYGCFYFILKKASVTCDLYEFESYVRYDLYRNTLLVRQDKKGSYYQATPMTIQALVT